MILLLDNFDSFTFNLVDYLNQLGVECEVVRNNIPIEQIKDKEFDGIVISPGPETPKKSGILMALLDHYHDKLPILGICIGHQAIGEYFGGSIVKAEKPMHGKPSKITHNDSKMFNNIPNHFQAIRYNSLLVKDIPQNLIITATSERKEVMALCHSSLPIWGIQYHPEAILTEFGHTILKNWIDQNNIVESY